MHTLVLLAAVSVLPGLPQEERPSRAYLGVDGRSLPKRSGVEVFSLDPGSPASEVLRTGDVVLFLSGRPTRTVRSLMKLVESGAPGDRVTLRVGRAGDVVELGVELADAKQHCDDGKGGACRVLGYRQQGAYRDWDRGYVESAKLYERACELGDAYGCGRLAMQYYFGNGVEKDRVRSTALYATACESKVSHGCLSFGEALLDGDGIEPDPARGVELLKWSCDNGQPYGCLAAAYAYEKGHYVPEDPAEIVDLYRRACRAQFTQACHHVWYPDEPTASFPSFPRATPELNEALFAALDASDDDEIGRLLEAGADPNAVGDLRGLRGVPLIVAAFFVGELDIVHALMDAGADVRSEESSPFSAPLTAAIARGNLEIVNRMLELGARVQPGDLGQAADGGTSDVMERLMQEGIDVDDRYLGTMPVVLAAARRQELENIEFLLSRGADIDATESEDSGGHTALTYVLDERDADTAVFLIERGADPNLTNLEGRTPLHVAASLGMVEVVKKLLERGADPDNVDDSGMSVLQLAIMAQQVESVRALIDGGADATKVDPNGATPLMYAAAVGSDAICEILLNGGAQVNVVATSGILAGKSALTLAVLGGYDEIAKRLRAAGAGDPM